MERQNHWDSRYCGAAHQYLARLVLESVPTQLVAGVFASVTGVYRDHMHKST